MMLVEISHVSRDFGKFRAVNDVSLTLGEGEILGLIGANGAGKTTLLRMVCGLLKPSEGTVRTEGRPGYMCQSFSLVEELTIRESFQFYGALYGLGRAEIAERMDHETEALNLGPWMDRQVRALPSGWRQMLSFSIAMLSRPKVLILDEPTSGVDLLARKRLWELIRAQAAKGTGIIVSTHYLDEAALCDTLAVMGSGSILALGRPEAVAPSQDVLLSYFR